MERPTLIVSWSMRVDIANMRAGFRCPLGNCSSQECPEFLRVLALWLCQLGPAFASPVSGYRRDIILLTLSTRLLLRSDMPPVLQCIVGARSRYPSHSFGSVQSSPRPLHTPHLGTRSNSQPHALSPCSPHGAAGRNAAGPSGQHLLLGKSATFVCQTAPPRAYGNAYHGTMTSAMDAHRSVDVCRMSWTSLRNLLGTKSGRDMRVHSVCQAAYNLAAPTLLPPKKRTPIPYLHTTYACGENSCGAQSLGHGY